MMFSKFTPNEQLELYRAFTKACAELGISYSLTDTNRREQLAALMISLANDGMRDLDDIRAQAVHRMRPPASGSFFNRG